MNKLLKGAIADAKAVRETALANAKLVLAEAFAPKIQSMLSSKIKEEMDDEEMDGMEDELESVDIEDGLQEDEFGDEAPEEDEFADEAPAEEAPAEDEFADEAPAEDPAPTDEAPAEEAPAEDEGDVSDEELEELIRELEGDDESEMDADLEGLDEAEDEEAPEASEEAPAEDEEVDLNELIKALREEDEEEEPKDDKMEAVKADLQEAYKAIKFMKAKLQEVNLLNAKLLFVNKLFKKSDLNEAQKMRVIETFDRAKSVREAKIIYTTLAEAAGTSSKRIVRNKKKMNEGLSSAPQKKTRVIENVDPQIARFKELVKYNSANN